MKSVRQLAEEIVDREGGFVNDPDDPGGKTKYGVTEGTLKALNMATPVEDLTRQQAVNIFIEHYYTRPRIDLLPRELQPAVFDMYVNGGTNAVRILQRMVGVDDDGQIGPKTAAACINYPDIVNAYGIQRREFYYSIGDRRPASRKYARRRDGGKGGWILRAEEFMDPRFHFTPDQHKERTRKWD